MTSNSENTEPTPMTVDNAPVDVAAPDEGSTTLGPTAEQFHRAAAERLGVVYDENSEMPVVPVTEEFVYGYPHPVTIKKPRDESNGAGKVPEAGPSDGLGFPMTEAPDTPTTVPETTTPPTTTTTETSTSTSSTTIPTTTSPYEKGTAPPPPDGGSATTMQ